MSNSIIYLPAGSGRSVWFFGCKITFLVTGAESDGIYSTMELVVEPEAGPGPHTHPLAEEQFYILDGTLHFKVGDMDFYANTGDFVHIPRGTVHSWTNEAGRPVRTLATFSPAGMEGHFLRLGEPYSEGSTAPPITPEFLERIAADEAEYRQGATPHTP